MSARKRKRRGSPSPPPAKQTKKERREEIRQVRIEAQRRRMRTKRRRRTLTVVLIVLVAGSGTAFGISRYLESRQTVDRAIKVAGCSKIEEFDAQPAVHIDGPNPPPRNPYNSDPPTSGDHSGAPPATWGSYTETLPPERFVHNLEHGGIVIHYKNLTDKDVDALEKLADSYQDGVIAMPNESIKKKLVLTQWAHTQICSKYSEKVVLAFIRARCNKGVPEPVSTCAKAP